MPEGLPSQLICKRCCTEFGMSDIGRLSGGAEECKSCSRKGRLATVGCSSAIMLERLRPAYCTTAPMHHTMSTYPGPKCGAVKNKGCDIATHFIRTALDFARTKGVAIAVVFVDLVKAFDRVIREFVIGWAAEDGSPLQTLIGMGLSEEHAVDVYDFILKYGTVAEQMNLPESARQLLRSLHAGSWFAFNDTDTVLVVNKGGRQGCRFGGVLFNLVYACALKHWHSKMKELGITTKVSFSSGRFPGMAASFTHDREAEKLLQSMSRSWTTRLSLSLLRRHANWTRTSLSPSRSSLRCSICLE